MTPAPDFLPTLISGRVLVRKGVGPTLNNDVRIVKKGVGSNPTLN